MIRELHLLRGQVTLVDSADYDALTQYRWRLNNRGYVVRSKYVNGREVIVCIHREILQAQRGQIVDHIDHDKLNNTRENLRFITQQQNLMYRRCFRNNQSGYKGVASVQGKWRPRIQFDGKPIYL